MGFQLRVNKWSRSLCWKSAGLALVLAAGSNPAVAQLTQNMAVDTKALALGNAVTADPPGINSIHYNPAGLAKLKGRHFSVTLLNLFLEIGADFDAPDGYNVFGIDGTVNDPIIAANDRSKTRQPAIYIPGWGLQKLIEGPGLLPSQGISFNSPGSKFTFGTAVYAPQLAGYYRSFKDPARYLAKAVAMERLTYLSPTFGYEINDEWSVGAGINLSYHAIAIDMMARAPNMLMGVTEIVQDAIDCQDKQEPLMPFLGFCGGNVGPWDDVGSVSFAVQETLSPTFNIGVLWEPTDWFSWGASYTSEGKMKLKGDYELVYTDDWAGFWNSFSNSLIGSITGAILGLPTGVPREAGNLSMDLRYPQHFQTGISVKVHPRLTFNMDVGWTDYSVWNSMVLKFDRNLEFLTAARLLSPSQATPNTMIIMMEYQDVWNWAFGVEFHATSRLDLRAGVEIRDSVIPDHRRDTMNPFGGANLYSVGLGYRWDRNTEIDLSLSYMRSYEDIPAGTSCNVNCDHIQNIVYNPYAGLDVQTKLRVVIAGLTFRTKF